MSANLIKRTDFWKSPSPSQFYFSGKFNMSMSMSMEHWWKDDDRTKPKYAEQNLHQFNLVHYRSHTGCPGIEPEPPRRQPSD